MSKLQNNFTTPEQSKILLELGVPADSADCYYKMNLYSFKTEMCFTKEDNILYHYTPCWSVGRLVEIWELCTSIKFERWTHNGVYMHLLDDCIAHIIFALNSDTNIDFDFSKLEE